MAERGMANDAKVLHRAQLEATFACCAVAKDEEVMRRFVASDLLSKRKLLEKLVRNADAGAGALTPEELAQVKNELLECKKAIAVEKPKDNSTEWLAEKAGMHATYLSAYAYFSAAVHSGPRDIEQYLDVASDGSIMGFRWGPDASFVPKLIATTIETLSFALRAIEQVYNLGDHNWLHTRLATLAKVLE